MPESAMPGRMLLLICLGASTVFADVTTDDGTACANTFYDDKDTSVGFCKAAQELMDCLAAVDGPMSSLAQRILGDANAQFHARHCVSALERREVHASASGCCFTRSVYTCAALWSNCSEVKVWLLTPTTVGLCAVRRRGESLPSKLTEEN